MGVKISALPTATQAEAASGLIPVVTDPNGDGNLVTKHVTASSIGGGGANVNTSTTPPSNPSNGDLWFDEGNAELYIYNTSINGWIQTNGGGGSTDSGNSGGGILDMQTVTFTHLTPTEYDASTGRILEMQQHNGHAYIDLTDFTVLRSFGNSNNLMASPSNPATQIDSAYREVMDQISVRTVASGKLQFVGNAGSFFAIRHA